MIGDLIMLIDSQKFCDIFHRFFCHEFNDFFRIKTSFFKLGLGV